MRYLSILLIFTMISCSRMPFEKRNTETPPAVYSGVEAPYDQVYGEGGYSDMDSSEIPVGQMNGEFFTDEQVETVPEQNINQPKGIFRSPYERRYETPPPYVEEEKRDRVYKEPFGSRFYYEGQTYYGEDTTAAYENDDMFKFPQCHEGYPFMAPPEVDPSLPPLRTPPGVGKLNDLHGPFRKVYFDDGCYRCGRRYDLDWMEAHDPEEATEIILSYATELQHTMFLRLEYSWVYFDRYIEGIHLEFSTQNIMEVKEARQMIVDLVDGLLDRWNNDPIIAGLIKEPFTERNVNVYINLESFWGYYGDPFYVGWLVLEDGITFLYAYDTKDRLINYWHSRVEPFFKSREYVRIERAAEARYKKTHAPPPYSYLKKEQAFSLP